MKTCTPVMTFPSFVRLIITIGSLINLLHNEFTNAIKTLKNNKTPGIYHIRHEDLGLLANERENLELLLGCNMALQIIFGMFNDSCKKERVPKDLNVSVLRRFTKILE